MRARKSQSPAPQSAVAGKDEAKRKQSKADPFPLTNDERNFLIAISSAAGVLAPGRAGKPADSAAAEGGHNLLDDAWWAETAMPRLAAITEKVLRTAEAQYRAHYKDDPAGGAGAGQGSCGSGGASSKSGGSGTASPAAAGGASAVLTPPPPPAGTPAQFEEENAYMLEQLRQLPQCPFTVERLVEILADPYQHYGTKEGKLKPEALQAALRRCILVTYPVVVSAGDSSMGVE